MFGSNGWPLCQLKGLPTYLFIVFIKWSVHISPNRHFINGIINMKPWWLVCLITKVMQVQSSAVPGFSCATVIALGSTWRLKIGNRIISKIVYEGQTSSQLFRGRTDKFSSV